MVILQFNKLIRNKWVWGVFAIAISAFFAFSFLADDLMSGSRPEAVGDSVGKLGGKEVSAAEFQTLVEDARGIGNNRDEVSKPNEINRKAWRNLAAIRTAEKAGLAVTDAQLAQQIERMFGAQGGLDFNQYRMMLVSQLGVTPERFEAFLRRQMLVQSGIGQTMIGSSVWVSPMELELALSDMIDSYTVRVATFEQEKAEADAVKLDEAGLKKWFDEHQSQLALPDRMRVRLVKFDATDANVLAKMSVTEDAMLAYYDAIDENDARYTFTDTNGVKNVKKFDEIKGVIEQELRKIEAVTYFETNVSRRAYATLTESDKGKSRLDTIAAEDGLKVSESPWFAMSGAVIKGFAEDVGSICPGANNFLDEVSQIDADTEDFRYAIVSSDSAVWLVEQLEASPAHTPDFNEAKEKIMMQALRDAQADAFKAKVDAVIAKGADAVLATKNVSTNYTFSLTELPQGDIPDRMSVIRASMKLRKGELSEFTPTTSDKGIVVYCVDRTEGDVSKSIFMRSQVRDQLASGQFADLSERWMDWNLDKRFGFETTSESSVEAESAEEN